MGHADRLVPAWGLGDVVVGGASLLIPVYALTLGGGAFVVGPLAATAAFAGVPAALLVGPVVDRPEHDRTLVSGPMLVVAATLGSVPSIGSAPGLLVGAFLAWRGLASARADGGVDVGGTPETDQ